ncbi:Tetratricopeptide repeat domain 27, partial [Desmophyllum pertusum]
HALILFTGVACLDLFIQCNWTGPMPPLASVLTNAGQECSNQQIVARVSQDGEFFNNPLMDAPLFLLVAKIILVESEESLTICQSACLWALRCLAVQRELLNERNETMKNLIFHLMDKVQERTTLLSVEINRSISSQIHLELGYLYLYYYDTKRAREHFSAAKTNLGLQVDLTGALGKRSKFQQKDSAQLVLLVQREEIISGVLTDESSEMSNQQNLPRDVALDDDVLLNKIQFKDMNLQQNNQTVLSALDHAVILGLTCEHQKSQAVQKLNKEKLLAYLEVITSQPKCWCVHMTALLMRSRLEKDSTRRMERSMMQLQALVDSIENSSPKVADRQMLFYCVPLPPKWNFQRDLAQFLLGMGVVKSAVEIFQRLHSWEDVVLCYQSLGWYAKAETLIRDQLKIKETALLWCLLGDTLKDASCYEKAWELSGHRNSRAQRSLGYLYLRAKDYAKSIPCFQKSLEINSLQEGVWFSLGCAAMVTEDLEVSSKAFHRCVSLDSENGEAWNNLSNIYIKTGQKLRAHLALKEALKANYESWHMWENFLVVSVDIGAFNDAISAYHRMMDFREKYCDIEVLGILVKAVNQGILDNQEQLASALKPKVLELMGRLTSQVTNNSEVWKLYSDLCWNGESQHDKEKALNFLVKAHRTRTQAPGWENDVSQFKAVTELTLHLSQVYMEVSQCKENKSEAVQLLSSAKLILKQLITRAKKHHTDSLTGNIQAELSQSVIDMEASVQRTVHFISSLKS